jgi:hypothetical protein
MRTCAWAQLVGTARAAQRADAQKSTGPRDRWGNGRTTAQAPQNHPLIPSLSKEGKRGEAGARELDGGGEPEASATTGETPVPQEVEGNNAE